jgi:hypothetical protein
MARDNKKREDSFGQQREEWRRAYAEAQSVRERFPQVERLVIGVTFIDVKGVGKYSAQMRSFSAAAKAFFAFACPRTLCLHGGFDIDPIIRSSLDASRTTSSGNVECGGWVHPLHTEDARCLLQMRYEFEVVYALSGREECFL